MTNLMWFRADLRTQDNTALWHAGRDDDARVVGVFTICSEQWAAHDWGPKKVNFILRSLRQVSRDLAALRMPLKIITTPTFDDVPAKLLELAAAIDASALYFNREYEVNEVKRDERVATVFGKEDIDVHAFHDQVLTTPGDVMTKAGDWYSVYSPFRKRWTAYVGEHGLPRVHRRPTRQTETDVTSDDIPDAAEGFDADDDRPDLWPAGEHHAMSRLRAFVDARMEAYDDQRDTPSINGTSGLSPYLTVGAISPRQCVRSAVDANGGQLGTAGSLHGGPAIWISELIWREFYKHLLVGFPRLSRHQPFQLETSRITWRQDDAQFEAWTQGLTGFPIVDAAMRQLNATGWMHNRLRMIVAMFLTKDLFLDWRRGEQYFMQRLIDGDLAANNGGWQWSASTGTDAAPYFRIFNPVSQGRSHDPDGTFVREWVPELRNVKGKNVHEPWTLPDDHRPSDYPAPIIDHRAAREHAIEAFKALKSS